MESLTSTTRTSLASLASTSSTPTNGASPPPILDSFSQEDRSYRASSERESGGLGSRGDGVLREESLLTEGSTRLRCSLLAQHWKTRSCEREEEMEVEERDCSIT